MSFAPETETLAKPEAMLRVPVGLASPLWGLFAGAAVSASAWWWMTRWTRPQNLEALFGAAEAAVEPEIAVLAAPIAETVEAVIEATPKPVLETLVEATPEPVMEAVAEAAPEPLTEAIVEAPVEAVVEAAVEETPVAPVLEA
ncbi:MAG TPA: hypothetical protein VHN39_06115, partial [Phenylobacterium sp.]|nr:hypothetical protein [Phenylobacterium sp.]